MILTLENCKTNGNRAGAHKGNVMFLSHPEDCNPPELPERIEGAEPECPYCHTVHEMPSWIQEYHRFNCDCGARFEARKVTVIVSTPVEYRR